MTLCDRERCTGCGACAASCPQNSITMVPDEEGFLRPSVVETCIECGSCRDACPVLQPGAPAEGGTTAYAAANQDRAARLASSSGGIFSLLARWVLTQGGSVFGAAYGRDFAVVHRRASSLEELEALRKAKYAQSDLGGCFRQVKELLEGGEQVLFTGTPCQTEGLRTFLGRPYDGLLLVDTICHGVPSPRVWQRYISYRREQDAGGAQPVAIDLRSKETGWPGYSIRFGYEGGASYSVRNGQDPYLRCFVGDLCLRPSCYRCPFKGIERPCDFTLGDYWGIWDQLPGFDDGMGSSLVLIHSDKARRLWEQIQPQMTCREVLLPQALRENPSALRSSALPAGREAFMDRYEEEDFQALVDELLPRPQPSNKPSLLQRGLGKIKRSLLGGR